MGAHWKRHVDHLRARSEDVYTDIQQPATISESDQIAGFPPSAPSALADSTSPNAEDNNPHVEHTGPSTCDRSVPTATSETSSVEARKYPNRNRQPPERLYGTLRST